MKVQNQNNFNQNQNNFNKNIIKTIVYNLYILLQ